MKPNSVGRGQKLLYSNCGVVSPWLQILFGICPDKLLVLISKEVKLVKKICKNMEIVTPGIRLSGDNAQDQNKNRVVSPKSAFNNGATAIVIGRSITEGSIKNNLQKLIKSLN